MMLDIKLCVENADQGDLKSAIVSFLTSCTTPAFCALPKVEIELLMLQLLQDIGAVSSEPEAYELVSQLKITQTKARALIYAQELRSSSEKTLDEKVRLLLRKPILQKKTNQFALEIDNPLVANHLRARLKSLGYLSDGSFSPSIVKLSLDAFVAMIDFYLTEAERKKVAKALIAAGAPDGSFKGVLRSTIVKLASKVAAESGEAMVKEVAAVCGPIIDGVADDLKARATGLFDKEGN
jgi:hypothetical protein